MVSMEEQKKRRARRKFTDEFKARAVRLVLKEGQTAAQVARDLDLVESVLHGWVRQAKIDRGMGPAGALTSEEREELSRLRKENRVLKEEREILKKAAAFFARDGRSDSRSSARRRRGTRFRCSVAC
jgi:transposase